MLFLYFYSGYNKVCVNKLNIQCKTTAALITFAVINICLCINSLLVFVCVYMVALVLPLYENV